jgi:phage/conjugal plasmid C-4 type zinc finger TraR family protein
MASGWAPDSAVQDQIDDTVADAVSLARAKLPVGAGESHCIECGEPIPERRRQAVPSARTCVPCQTARDANPVRTGINRRGSKDSQLR